MAESNASAGRMYEWLERMGRNGELNASTAKAYISTHRKVLAVLEEDDPDQVDIRKLDVENLLERFETLHRLDYSHGSLDTYKSRFRASNAMFLAFLDGDREWKSAGKSAAPVFESRTARIPTLTRKRLEQSRTRAEKVQRGLAQDEPEATGLVKEFTHRMPLRMGNVVVSINLPVDLTTSEADHLARWIKNYAIPDGVASQPVNPGGD